MIVPRYPRSATSVIVSHRTREHIARQDALKRKLQYTLSDKKLSDKSVGQKYRNFEKSDENYVQRIILSDEK